MDTSSIIESFVFGARDWILIAVILSAATATLAIWSYAARSQLSRLRLLTMGLKIAAVAALAFCLLEPMRRVERPRPGANVMAIVVDNSQSMTMRPPGETLSRVDRIREQLATEAAWQARLAQDFDVRRYAFEERLHAVEELSTLEFDGNNSSLSGAITTLRDRFARRPVAGMVLFTDGLATDEVKAMLEEPAGFPVYPIVYGEDSKLQDITISSTTAAISDFELAPASVEAVIEAMGLAGEGLVVRLLDGEGKTLEKQNVTCESNSFEQKVRFQFRPPNPGFQMVRVRAMLASEDSDDPEKEPESRREITTLNNSRLVAIDRGGGPFRILYVAGRPNWEFKFVRRALEEDLEINLQALIRIAKEEPKFSFRDQAVDSSNPLLAGFEDDDEGSEQYDEPVLMRVGVEDNELKAGFPSGEEDLFAYDAIMLDDVEASFFTQQQMLLMRRFVAERGGGLMMLGGQENFLGGGYKQTPLGDILPVYLRGQENTFAKSAPVRYRLTREGGLEPWLRLRASEADEKKRVREMPDFLTWNTVADAKPGASVLASLETSKGSAPGLVTQRFGKGRTLALLVGDLWRWSMRRAEKDTDDLAQSWRQISRWLVNDAPKRLAVEVEAPTDALSAHRLNITLLDPGFSPMDNATINLTVTEPDGGIVMASATASADRPGVYEAEYWSKLDGGYRCEVNAIAPDGEEFEPVTTGWTAEPSATEFARIQPDRELLKQLAEKSGGELIAIEDLDTFVETLPTKKVPITESRVEPLWHRPWFVLLAIGCLCLEWGLRRWKGLP